MCTNKEYISNIGSDTEDSVCLPLTECLVAEGDTLEYQFSGYSMTSDRVCHPCKEADKVDGDVKEVDGRKPSPGAKRHYELICVSEGISTAVVVVIVLLLLLAIAATAFFCYHRRRKITVKVDIAAATAGDANYDGATDGKDILKKFDQDCSGGLDAKELQAMQEAGLSKDNKVTLDGDDDKINVGATTTAN